MPAGSFCISTDILTSWVQMEEGWLQVRCYSYRGAITSDTSTDLVPLSDMLAFTVQLYQTCLLGSYMSQCQNSSKFLSVSYLMKTADVIMIFFFFTQYYWSYLIRLADKTEKYWCVNIFFIGLKPHFLAFLPVQRKKMNFPQELFKKLLFSQEF